MQTTARKKKNTAPMNKDHCLGCRNDFYNGNNDLGVKECWSLKTARLVMRKEVHINQRPPWDQKPIEVPNCYRRPQFVYVDGDQTK